MLHPPQIINASCDLCVFCVCQADMLPYMTVLPELKSVEKCKSDFQPYLFKAFFRTLKENLMNWSCCIYHRLLLLRLIFPNCCYQKDELLHYITALSELKSVAKCKGYSKPFVLYSHFLRELTEFSPSGHVASITDYCCFIRYSQQFAVEKKKHAAL